MEKPEKYKTIYGMMQYEKLYDRVFSELKPGAHIVEIGCWEGRSACYMAEMIKAAGLDVTFDCIDIWKKFLTGYVHDVVAANDGTIVDLFTNNLRKAGVLQYVNVIQKDSLSAVNLYPDNSLDFVFIDDDHTYLQVMRELPVWYRKVKKGGLLCGDDYTLEDSGVKQAVDEFVGSLTIGLELIDCGFLIRKI